MPRRARPVEHDDVIDDTEYRVYPRRAKGEPLVDLDARYGHRIPHEPVGEILERRHAREKVRPDIPHESYEYLQDDALVADRLARLDLNAYSPEKIEKYVNQRLNARQTRGRPQSKASSVEETYFSPDESKQIYTDSESDEIENYLEKTKRPTPRHKPDIRKEPLSRSKHVKEEKRTRRPVIEEPIYTKSSRSVEEVTEDWKGSHGARPRSFHRSHYNLGFEAEDDESDMSEDSELEDIPKHRRQRVTRRNRVELKYPSRTRDISSSSSFLSSSESPGSSESELPKVPLPVPIPPVYKDPSRRHKSLSHGRISTGPFTAAAPPLAETGFQLPSPPTPPRVPSLETVLSERDARHRYAEPTLPFLIVMIDPYDRNRIEKAAKETVGVERRSRESLHLPHEPPVQRKKEKPIAIVETPEIARKRDAIVQDERLGPRSSYKKHEIVEEDYYRSRDPHWSSPSSETMEGWAIVQAPAKPSNSSEKEVVDVCEERHSRHKQQLSKAAEKEREHRHKGDRPRSKVGPRYIGVRDRKDRLWTEITKDLVVKEAIDRAGYEYEEMDTLYYIFSYLHPVSRVSIHPLLPYHRPMTIL
jgi:hypothetical protein